ncbi:MAG: DUF3488 and transglutaminase-like domain-containing protein [Pseudomonadota bacterium]
MRVDGSLKHSLGWTIAALLVAYAPQLTTKPIWISGLLLVCAGLRWSTEVRRGRLIPTWLRLPIGIGCFIAVLASYGGVNGVAPGSALLSVMAALKLLETRNRRDEYVILYICLFLMLSTFLAEQHLWSIAYLLFGFLVTMAAWVSVSRRAKVRPARWYARQGLKTTLYALPLLLCLWILFPRVPGPFWAIPTEAGKARTGLSSTLSPGDISTLSESQEVAFRVRFQSIAPPRELLYWRAIVMHNFDGRTWAADEPVYGKSSDVLQSRGESIRYTITMEPTRQRWLYALDMPASWRGQKIYRTGYNTLQRMEPVNDRLAYEARSLLQYAANLDLQPRSKRWYTRLPPDNNPQAVALANQLADASSSTDEYVRRVLSYFREQPFYYTLSPPALGRNAIDEFLLETRRGFCEHYASAFAFLMRAAGIPARIVAGYQGGTESLMGDYMIVRQSDAHAWNEIWLEGQGWVRVDPTAAVAPSRIEQNLNSALQEYGERAPGAFDLPAFENLKLTWDLINARYNEWVLGFGPETQRDFLAWLGIDSPDWRDQATLLAIILTALMAMIALWLAWLHRPPRRDDASRWYQRLQRRLKLPAVTGEAPRAYSRRARALFPLQAEAIDASVEHYLAVRYGGNARQFASLRRAVRQIKRRWRAHSATAPASAPKVPTQTTAKSRTH